MKVDELVRFHSSFYSRWDQERARHLWGPLTCIPAPGFGNSQGMRAVGADPGPGPAPELLILDEPTGGWTRMATQVSQTLAGSCRWRDHGALLFISSQMWKGGEIGWQSW